MGEPGGVGAVSEAVDAGRADRNPDALSVRVLQGTALSPLPEAAPAERGGRRDRPARGEIRAGCLS